MWIVSWWWKMWKSRSSAVAAAAVLEGAVEVEGPAAVVLTGANVDAARLAEVLSDHEETWR